MTNFVQLYKSTDANAPSLTGQVGSLVTLLNKCLVDGYTAASVTSITRVGSTATVTIASNTTLVNGNYVTIAGCDQADYNGTFQITVLSATQFTYTVANSPATPATGTITYAKAGLGWTRPFVAGTNSQTYRSADITTNQFYLQVIDNAATAGGSLEAQVYGAEVMTADQTVSSGQFPTAVQLASGLCWRKSNSADGTARPWSIIGDGRTFYLNISWNGTWGSSTLLTGFGHFITYKSGDAYNTFINGLSTFNSSSASGGMIATQGATTAGTTGLYVARSYTQLGTSLNAGSLTLGTGSYSGGSGSLLTYPNPVDSGYYVMPMYIVESGALRGRFPGAFAPLHSSPLSEWEQVTNVSNLSGITLVTLVGTTGSTQGQCVLDVFGPWNS